MKYAQKVWRQEADSRLAQLAEGEEAEGVAAANLFLNHGTITYLQGQKYPQRSLQCLLQKPSPRCLQLFW